MARTPASIRMLQEFQELANGKVKHKLYLSELIEKTTVIVF